MYISSNPLLNDSELVLSLSQSAFLFSLSRRGSAVSAVGIRREACVLSAALTELVFTGVLLPEKENAFVFSGKEAPEYLAPLCADRKTGSVLTLEPFLNAALFTAPSPTMTQLNLSLGESLCRLGFCGRESNKKYTFFPPCRAALDLAAEQLKKELFSDTPLSTETAALCYLLNSTGLWNRMFSRKELDEVEKRIPGSDHTLTGRILGTIDRLDGIPVTEAFSAC